MRGSRERWGRIRHPRGRRVAAVADFLIGMPLEEVARKHGVSKTSIYDWMYKVRSHFKLRLVPGASARPRRTRTPLVKRSTGRTASADTFTES